MKRYLLLSIVVPGVFAVMSCHKSGSSNNNSNSNNWLSSATESSPQSRMVDSFYYDNSHRLSLFTQSRYDTTSGSPVTYYWTAQFTLPASSSAPPSGYVYTINSVTDQHLLSYDGQGRVIKDTSVSGSGYVAYFTYPSGNIAINVLWNGTIANNMIDTMFLSSGNVTSIHEYAPNNAGTADSLQGSIQFGYGSVANPLYHAAMASSFGPLLFILQIGNFGGSLDAVSQHAFNSFSGTGNGLPPGFSINFSQNTDNQGRLTKLSASYYGVTESLVFTYY